MLHWRRPGSLLASAGRLLARTGLTPFCLHSSLLRYGLIGKLTFYIVLLIQRVGHHCETPDRRPVPAQELLRSEHRAGARFEQLFGCMDSREDEVEVNLRSRLQRGAGDGARCSSRSPDSAPQDGEAHTHASETDDRQYQEGCAAGVGQEPVRY